MVRAGALKATARHLTTRSNSGPTLGGRAILVATGHLAGAAADATPQENPHLCAADFGDWKQQSRSFELLSAFEAWTINIIGADRPEPVQRARIGAEFFEIFGMKPIELSRKPAV
jgi:hypothetical protein